MTYTISERRPYKEVVMIDARLGEYGAHCAGKVDNLHFHPTDLNVSISWTSGQVSVKDARAFFNAGLKVCDRTESAAKELGLLPWEAVSKYPSGELRLDDQEPAP